MAMFLSVKPQFNAHLIAAEPDGTVTRFEDLTVSDVRINGGFFVFKREILDWIEPGDELVDETFARLIPKGEVVAYRHEGFWRPMDTIKDRQSLEALHESGDPPWLVRRPRASSPPGTDALALVHGHGRAAPPTSRRGLSRRRRRDRLRGDAAHAHPSRAGSRGRTGSSSPRPAIGSVRHGRARTRSWPPSALPPSRCTASATRTSRTPAPR